MARCTFMGHLIEEDKCPACGGAGYPLNVRRDMQMARLYTLSMAVVPAPDVRLTVRWGCSPCALEWETEEQEGQIATRFRSRAWSVLPSLNPAVKPLAIPADLIPPIPEPEPPEPPRVINGSVIGYRAWRIVDWQLYGTGVNRAWEPGVQQATCDVGKPKDDPTGLLAISTALSVGLRPGPPHSAPHPGCHCGINALARFDQGDSHWVNADVFGAIEAWGETDGDPETEHGGFHLHRNGFRARYAKVVLLAVEDDWPAAKRAAVRALAREHEADVCKREHLEDAAKEHGQLVPDEMLEWVRKTEGRDDGLLPWQRQILRNYLPAYSVSMQSQGIAANNAAQQLLKATQQLSRLTPYPAISEEKKVRKPGICQTLGYPGPPASPTTKYQKGQRVADSKAVIWTCVKGGKPGRWEREVDAG